ncbi:MAG: peptidase [Candidatus Eremiobacteraeota bacterium]|nr:peptidase [Candidatus Eremiobacteraeota bacterium]
MRSVAAAAAALTVSVCAAVPAAAEAPGIDAARLGSAIRAAAVAHFGLWDPGRRASFASAWSRYRSTSARVGARDAVALEAIRLVASLRNAHTSIDDPAFAAARRWRLPFVLRYVEGAWIVTKSRSRDIPSGAELRAIDGLPPERFFASHRDLVFASSDAQAHSLLEVEMRSVDNDAHPPRLTFDDGRELTPSANVPDAIPPRVAYHWLIPDRVAYIAVPSFDGDTFERDALTALKRFITAEAIVIDVRGNGGGSTPVDFLELLTDRALPWWKESTNAPLPARKPVVGQQIPPADGHYDGRVVVLADDLCIFACEDFVMPLVYGRRARFVGSRTAGSTGKPFVVQLDGGITLALGSIQSSLPDGKPFEGIGIEPTDPAPLRTADVKAGIDAQLDRALAVAEAKPEMRTR